MKKVLGWLPGLAELLRNGDSAWRGDWRPYTGGGLRSANPR